MRLAGVMCARDGKRFGNNTSADELIIWTLEHVGRIIKRYERKTKLP